MRVDWHPQVGSATVPFRSEWGRYRLTPNHTAYIRVAEGCDHACTCVTNL
jgi:ribosomal protein S12 methylthiotransferase